MRPIRLEIEGFGPYRDRTVVDFEGVDLFALTGATGSGKTSVVDGIVFALYGAVPRYDDRRLVGAAIAQGANEARVRLDFTVGGTDYTAVRIVRRQKGGGASTKEARLESGDGTVLAGNERELGARVEELLGLGYDHFTKCVVLPQGEFARFLHDKPSDRQTLLVELLDLTLYSRMATLARSRASASEGTIAALAQRLATLAAATPDARKPHAQRVTALKKLRDQVDAVMPALASMAEAANAATAEAVEATRRVGVLRGVCAPEGMTELDARVTDASAALDLAGTTLDQAAEAVEAAELTLKGLPHRRSAEAAAEAFDLHARHRAQQVKGEKLLNQRRAAEQAAADAMVAAEADRELAAADLERVQTRHRAHAVALELEAGEPCPVCEQLVTRLPLVMAPPDLDVARSELRAAELAVADTRNASREAHKGVVEVESKLAAVAEQLLALEARVADFTDAAEVELVLHAVAQAEAELNAAIHAEREARAGHVAARAALDQAQRASASAQSRFDAARDAVAAFGAPARTGGGLASEWNALVEWAAAELDRQEQRAGDATARAATVDAERTALLRDLAERSIALDVEIAGRPPRDAVVDALATAEATLAQLDRDLAEADTCRAELQRVEEARQVAIALGQHLNAKNFEKWVLDEALGLLVAGATGILLELSAGQYSMALDDKSGNFMVVDHRNADEVRSARSLSGGETFLASLALALALADQLALLAAKGTARLESIFLDEGFGTLDADSLDVVAAAIEELGARGRMVGLISHVAELADRVPVRFEVTKVGNAASIKRIDQ